MKRFRSCTNLGGPGYYVSHQQKGIIICLFFLTYQAFKSWEGLVSGHMTKIQKNFLKVTKNFKRIINLLKTLLSNFCGQKGTKTLLLGLGEWLKRNKKARSLFHYLSIRNIIGKERKFMDEKGTKTLCKEWLIGTKGLQCLKQNLLHYF